MTGDSRPKSASRYVGAFMSNPFAGNPFAKLKELELKILAVRDVQASKARIERLRRLAGRCRRANPDAEEAVCYHGALALIYEADGRIEKAIKHREVEIAKIRRLHELAALNPNDRYALQTYRKKDLRDRERWLKRLYVRRTTVETTGRARETGERRAKARMLHQRLGTKP
jgi:hypothetical protein